MSAKPSLSKLVVSLAAIVGASLLSVACTDVSIEPRGDGDDITAPPVDVPDVPDVQADLPDVNGDVTDAGEVADGADVPFVPECPEEGLQPGLCPCSGNGDCESELCLATADGKLCSELCEQTCPAGWTCATLVGTCPDCVTACIPRYVNLCRPCATNAECANPYSQEVTGDRCLYYGDAGSYCGAQCDGTQACPAGYSCQEEVQGVDGLLYTQCVPDVGFCDCSPLAVEQGAQTTCLVSNDNGSCGGARVCGPDGLTACDGPIPQPEQCDGADNDCDGIFDEGSCPKGEVCSCEGDACSCGCAPGFTDCGGGCIDVLSSVQHCGDCDRPCVAEHVATAVCGDGQCGVAKCEAGWEDFDNLFETGCECQISDEVCDGLDNDCDGQTDEGSLCAGSGNCSGECVAAKCICPSGCSDCQGTCLPDIVFATDVDNCGFCGHVCDLNHAGLHGCDDGVCCPLVCEDGFKNCNGSCSDGCEWEVAPETCDGVDNDCNQLTDEGLLPDCAAPKTCFNGTCVCPPDQPQLTECPDGDCADLATDANDCGFCGNDCATLGWDHVAVYSCKGGQCGIQNCQPPWVDADGDEFNGCECQKTASIELCDGVDNDCDSQTDEAPLTACNNPKLCLGGLCICDPATPGLIDCGFAQCVDTQSNPLHCGGCNLACQVPGVQNQVCQGGECVVGGCLPGLKDCNGLLDDGCEFVVAPETCNGFDDNCDGLKDEAFECSPGQEKQEACGDCGSRTLTCLAGCFWSAGDCSTEGICTPGEVADEVCGKCGERQRTCTDQCSWAEWGQCTGQGACVPGQIDTDACGSCGSRQRICSGSCEWGSWGACSDQGVCVPGDSETQACGVCGSQTRTCTGLCGWSEWGPCSGQGVCAPGQDQEESCGACGSRTRSCTAQCGWSPWGSCQGQGVCTAGQTQTEGCGSCGSRSRTCSGACGWGSWSSCGGQGQCSPGQTGTQGCGNCGSQSRSCSSSCQWNSWGSCGGQGVCSPSASESCPSACGVRSCGGQCSWSSCNYTTDGNEPNDAYSNATNLGNYGEGSSIPPVTNVWLHSNSDFDRYYIWISESGDIFDWTLKTKATLSSTSGWHSLCLYYDRGGNGSVEVTRCTSGYGSLSVDTGDVDANDGGDDDGYVDIEVYGDGSCAPYTLQLSVD